MESSLAESVESTVDPSAPVALDEMEVPPEVQSPFGADAEVVSDIAIDSSDEFGEREITFDGGAEPVADEPSAADHDFAAIQMDAPAEEEAPVVVDEAPPVAEEAPAAPEEAEEAPAAPEGAPGAAPAGGGGFQFGKRTPEDKAKSLARSLVSDLIAYNPEKHKEALTAANLQEVFGEEIEKSLKEYQEQVEPDVMAKGSFFNEALNSILAEGQSIFTLDD